jgi:hypothetical protein
MSEMRLLTEQEIEAVAGGVTPTPGFGHFTAFTTDVTPIGSPAFPPGQGPFHTPGGGVSEGLATAGITPLPL